MPPHRPLLSSSTSPATPRPTTTTTAIMRMRSHFSTTTPSSPSSQLNSNSSSSTRAPSAPAAGSPSFFSLKRVSPNPRVRMAVGAGLAVLAIVDVYLVEKHWPQIAGRGGAAAKEGGEGQA
ncbi:hypothetical protein N658DRAFT_308186 [Parathielavia hyrcaniae]|uniref:Uncharacterized protein n=1 Tax=Parathielavia hyrcaniae TaxID=113614 RepID=A0AAN6Q5J7_9PEZI|nr:hypothetical protein N658DRAFT_308186 [Parathielavia hyrcaniae]